MVNEHDLMGSLLQKIIVYLKILELIKYLPLTVRNEEIRHHNLLLVSM